MVTKPYMLPFDGLIGILSPHQLVDLDIDLFRSIEMFQGVATPPPDTLHDLVIVTGKIFGAGFAELLKNFELRAGKNLFGRINGCGFHGRQENTATI